MNDTSEFLIRKVSSSPRKSLILFQLQRPKFQK